MTELYVLRDVKFLEKLYYDTYELKRRVIKMAGEIPIVKVTRSKHDTITIEFCDKTVCALNNTAKSKTFKSSFVPLKSVWWKSESNIYYRFLNIEDDWSAIYLYYCCRDLRSNKSWYEYPIGLSNTAWIKDLKISSILEEI